MEADLILSVGSRLSDFTTSSRWQFQNPEAEILSINVNRFDAYKMNAQQILADAKLSLLALDNAIGGYRAAYAEGELSALKAEWDAEVDRVLSLAPPEGLAQTRVLGEMAAALADDDILISAAGSLPDDVRKFWRARGYKSYHVEYGFSCMGYEVNAALGAKLAAPGREVWAVVGDGTWQMLHSEFLTAIQENVKITVVVFDNQGFGCIENLQTGQGIPSFCTQTNHRDAATGRLTGPPLRVDYARVAEGYGAKGYTARSVAELRAALQAAKAETGVTLIDVKVLPRSMGPRYESWWRVGTPQCSDNPKVMAAWAETQEGIRTAWQY
jgi:3D-(3,5/4)-trihydroxycyclohexane-1,2-dione acylhydrolase (decyclizing)